MDEVILKVHEIGAAAQYGKTKITAEPVGDVLYVVKVNLEEHFQVQEDGTKIFTVEGIRHLIRNLEIVLTTDVSKQAF
jgi:hypothetical protein